MASCGSTPELVRSRSAARAMGWTCNAVPDERSTLETEIAGSRSLIHQKLPNNGCKENYISLNH